MSTDIVRPLRSMSYNDIKKRRMLRQKSKSRCKLKSSQASTQIIQTQKKVYPPTHDIYASQRPNEIDQVRQLKEQKLQKIKANEAKATVKRNITNNFSIPLNKNSQIKDHNNNYKSKILSEIQLKLNAKTKLNEDRDQQKLPPCSHSRQIVKELIEESKSERKLILYQNLRNKYKLSKSRSQSKSAKSLLDKSRILAKRLIQIDGTPEKPVDHALKGIKNSNRIKRFESVNQRSSQQNGNSFRYLISVPRDNSNSNVDLFKGNKKKPGNYRIDDQVQSSIEVQKKSEVFDSSDDKFLEQICLKAQKSHQVCAKRASADENQNLLDLLDVEQRQVAKAISKKNREKKILKDLQKLNRKFPKGFFKF